MAVADAPDTLKKKRYALAIHDLPKGYISDHQHGFLPGRGSGLLILAAAWKDIMQRIRRSKSIYEYDLSCCPLKIRRSWAAGPPEGLGGVGLPLGLIYFLFKTK